MRQISDEQRRIRLARRQALATDCRVDSVEAAARATVCLHATEPSSVHLAAWARSGASRADVDRSLYADRSIVKQLAMRRTVFAFPRDLLPAVWGSASARVASTERERLARDVEKSGIARDGRRWVTRTTMAVHELIAERGPLTTTELRAAIPALDKRFRTGRTDSKWGGEFPIAPRVLTALAASGRIVRGDNAGGWKASRPRWTLTGDWLPDGPSPSTGPGPVTPDLGYTELVRRWLERFGPGTEADIVWWLGATKTAVRRALTDLDAVEVALADGVGWVLPDDLDPEPEVSDWAALLPALDPTTMGWKHREFYLGPHRDKLFDSAGNGGPSAWWNGRIVGGWTQHPDSGDVIVVPAEPLDPAARRALDDRAARLTEWLDGERVNSIYLSPLGRSFAP
ncbi:winged helix DNA-binding domain-containing protein [Nakamurella lactea]|uniref:winged helix DNA-binding domain-containing protein n=1 Tax=Nakamurella lactea TaxID=459515 RepID=UPI000405AEF1|nr:winged helix DNA-binding domain-containing protein [Nakamurella lactea]